MGIKKITNMLPTKVSMFYELLETILPFCLRYLHLDLFQFLHRYLSLLYVSHGKIAPSFGRQVFPTELSKLNTMINQ